MSETIKDLDAGDKIQERNRSWWNQTPMSYDWREKITLAEGTREFFDEVDSRFYSSSPFYRAAQPYGRLIPFAQLKDKRVLEIGCGLGLHSQLMAEAGARLTSIDLTPRAVDLTGKRLALKGLKSDVRLMDAEKMEFADNEFDFVWSWGVIHHSAHTERIVSEVFRILKPGGEFRSMVYHKRSINALGIMTMGLLTGKFFKGLSAEDVFNIYSDGYYARFYTGSEFTKMLGQHGFSIKDVKILGQKSELVPIPGSGLSGRVKYTVVPVIPDALAEKILALVGGFLFVTAQKRV
ncbi:MAG TPA: methyltransferase domain-containing protein [Pyrinomonadaceae bacterium]|jgi:2-polyprenyl-3-methyl-5-hydroxy-6-metoxy-1,4-benzoquinol methylase|nr:methyltransferase domain-containing protein [Pyrinomonadaceae bacterium]